ncbi:MAG: HAD hydrolase family protein [Mailhella sp.]|nr:HAD hydrolase family protein [Mailhella sp.]
MPAYTTDFPGTAVDGLAFFDAARVRFIVLDVDGVCTDGKLYMLENGRAIKCFSSLDGLGIKTALKAGIGVGVITGRDDPCVHARMAQLGVKEYHPGHESKLATLHEIMERNRLAREEVAYMGDDWIDLDPMRSVGMPIAVANAVAQVKKEARYITAARGGEGAVREAVEFLLAARMDGKNPADWWTTDTGPAAI